MGIKSQTYSQSRGVFNNWSCFYLKYKVLFVSVLLILYGVEVP